MAEALSTQHWNQQLLCAQMPGLYYDTAGVGLSMVAVVQVEAYMYVDGRNRMRMRVYNVLDDIKRQHAFEPIITPPFESSDSKPRVDWHRFHNTRSDLEPETLSGEEKSAELQLRAPCPV